MPTSVALAGWECVDVLSHYPLCLEPGKPVSYCMAPADLMSMDSFSEILQLAREHDVRTAELRPDEMLVWDWLKSERYLEQLRVTPPFPCPDCIGYNWRTSGAPKRPRKGKKPAEETAEEKLTRERWETAQRRLLGIATRATVFCESMLYGGKSKAKKLRNERLGCYHKMKQDQKRIRILEKRLARHIGNGMLTAAEETRMELREIKSWSGNKTAIATG